MYKTDSQKKIVARNNDLTMIIIKKNHSVWNFFINCIRNMRMIYTINITICIKSGQYNANDKKVQKYCIDRIQLKPYNNIEYDSICITCLIKPDI